MERLRQVFVERYIGLVMVCAFLFEAVQYAAFILRPLFEVVVLYLYNSNRPADTFALTPFGSDPWWMTTYQIIVLLIDLLLAFLLFRWLYPKRDFETNDLTQAGREDS